MSLQGRFDSALRDLAVIALTLAAALLLAAATARAQTPGTDCGCSETDAYVAPDPGVKPPLANAATGLSPSGRYRVDLTSIPGQSPATLNVVRVSSGAVLLSNVTGVQWAFSPDGDRFVLLSSVGSFPNQQFEYALYDLAAGVPAPRIWNNGPSPWASARIRFSDDGAVFLFAGSNALGTSLALVEIASRSLYQTSFLPSSAPGNVDDDDDPAVAGWGFGPDPTRFWYGWNVDAAQGLKSGVLVNVATRVDREELFTANSVAPFFSPCGDVFAYVVKQLALPDFTDVTLYSTSNPLAAPLGTPQQLANSELEVQATAQQHQVMQGGVITRLADNVADAACPVVTNDPPEADFDAPPGAVEGTPASFQDQSTDSDGTVVAWHWDFGDGATSTSQSPSHTYAESGSYTVRLTVTDDDGATDFVERTVGVCASIASLSGRILYEEGVEDDLFVLNADDGSTVRLTNSQDSYSEIRSARFSPDGSKIAYEETGISLAGIWTMNADGSQRKRLTNGAGTTLDFAFHEFPAWSPDAQWIVFVNRDVQVAGAYGLWMVRADGTGLPKIPGTTQWDFQPNVAPEVGCPGVPPAQRGPGCYTIEFTRLDEVTRVTTLARIGGDGSGYAPLTTGSMGDVQISKDGSAYVYSRFLGLFGPLGGVHRIYTADRPFANPREITSGGDDVFWYPTFSPDGDAVAYSFSVNGTPGSANNLEIGVTDASGCSSRTLFSGPSQQIVQDWATGHATQSLGSIAGHVGLASGVFRTAVPFAVLELVGDYAATTTADANGDFVFENVPIGANVAVRFVSAPDHVAFPDPYPPTFGNLVGHAVGAYVYADTALATITATVQKESFERVPDVTFTAIGEGEVVTATTDANGVAAFQIQNYGTYTITPSKPGFRFEPPYVSGQLSHSWPTFTAIELPPPGLIAFVSSRDGTEDVWIADADGANATNLTGWRGFAQRDPAWSPDGRRLVFTSDENEAGFELWTYDLDADEFTSLEVWGREPAWSPDGGSIAYATDAGLRLLDLASGFVEDLTSDASDASPAWHPDGGAIAFERELGGETEIFEMPPEPGAFAFPITAYVGDDRDPAFAAVGGGFAFSTHYGDTSIPPRILAQWPLESYLASNGENPTWSQDGEQVAYDLDGAIHRIGLRAPAFATISDSGSDRDPAWQPDGVGACANGLDDDGDGFVDLADSGCTDPSDASERTSAPGCDNGLDDDGDGLTDMEDPGCPFPVAPYEDPLCDNGVDDDGDGDVDFADATCGAGWPYQESCGLGVELVAIVAFMRRRFGARRG